MKFRLGGKNKTTIVHVDQINRYTVQAREHTTEKDWVQFWTFIKYTCQLDFNSDKKVIGAKPHQLRHIKQSWDDKFRFLI